MINRLSMRNEKWVNIYGLYIYDSNDSINNSFYDKAFTYIKRFNEKLKEKKNMEYLRYHHQRIVE